MCTSLCPLCHKTGIRKTCSFSCRRVNEIAPNAEKWKTRKRFMPGTKDRLNSISHSLRFLSLQLSERREERGNENKLDPLFLPFCIASLMAAAFNVRHDLSPDDAQPNRISNHHPLSPWIYFLPLLFLGGEKQRKTKMNNSSLLLPLYPQRS